MPLWMRYNNGYLAADAVSEWETTIFLGNNPIHIIVTSAG